MPNLFFLPSFVSSKEPHPTLLLKINYALPEDVHQEFIALRDRRDAEIITPAENERLSTVSDRIEELAADRVVFEVSDPWLSPSQSNSCFWNLRQTSEILYLEIY